MLPKILYHLKRTSPVCGLSAGLLVLFLAGCQSSPTAGVPTVSPGIFSAKYTSDTQKADNSPGSWGPLNCHDPKIFRDDDGTYYVFSTDASIGGAWTGGVQVRKSTDLVHWTCLATPAIRRWDKAMLDWCGLNTQNASTWHPSVVKLNGKYYMYHGIITTNSDTDDVPRAWIGLAVADKVTGPYEPAGTVVRYCWDPDSGPLTQSCQNISEGSWNKGIGTIDPNIVRDDHGDLWMSYGSWKGGIAILRLDNKTGLPLAGVPADTVNDGLGVRIAGGQGASYEGSCVVNLPQSSYYYLFMSCGNVLSDYSVRVGRRPKAEGIAGPYFDSNGYDLTQVDSGAGSDDNFHLHGNKLLGSRQFRGEMGWRAPGGPSVLLDKDGRMFLAVHTRTNFLPTYYFYLQVFQMFLTPDGWPVVSPEEYDGGNRGPVTAAEAAGDYEVLVSRRSSAYGAFSNFEGNQEPLVNTSDAQETLSVPVSLKPDGTLAGSLAGTWTLEGENLTLRVEAKGDTPGGIYKGTALKATDWSKKGKANRDTLAVTAFCTATGEYLMGHKR